jgi:iron(III) transport system substrate-binding protein
MRSHPRLAPWTIRLVTLGALFLVACAPAAAPSPTAAPAKPTEAKPAATTAAAKPTEAPAAKPAEAKPALSKAEGPAASPATAAKPAAKADDPATMPINDLYERAKAEGGVFQCYCTMAQVNAEKFFPEFSKRFPGIKAEQIDATADKLVARIISEVRGGKMLADTFQGGVEYVLQLREQKLLREATIPEAEVYPAELKGVDWVSSDLQFIIAAWNTNLVKKEDEPKQFDDFADPKWKGKIIAEPRDLELLMGLAKHKFKDDQKALDLMKRIAANNPEFHSGHSELAEFLVAGQAAACLTCYSHHFPPRIAKGAPLGYLLDEGIGTILGTAVMKDSPHPMTAMLFHRWFVSEEGQKALANAGRTPAHPRVQPVEKTRSTKIYPIAVDDIKEWSKYEKLWKDTFGLR